MYMYVHICTYMYALHFQILNIKKFSVAEKLITFQGHSSAARSTWFDRAQTLPTVSILHRLGDTVSILHRLGDTVTIAIFCIIVYSTTSDQIACM